MPSRQDLGDIGERLVALFMLVVVALGAGLTLGHNTERLEELPGLLLMVPAAIALRGNVFGALGSRLGTAIHSGTFRLSWRPSSVVGENVCLLYTSPSPRDATLSRMPSSA